MNKELCILIATASCLLSGFAFDINYCFTGGSLLLISFAFTVAVCVTSNKWGG